MIGPEKLRMSVSSFKKVPAKNLPPNTFTKMKINEGSFTFDFDFVSESPKLPFNKKLLNSNFYRQK